MGLGVERKLSAMLPGGIALLVFGSIFVIAGKEFSREKDSEKIYAYFACVISVVSCIVSVLALLVR